MQVDEKALALAINGATQPKQKNTRPPPPVPEKKLAPSKIFEEDERSSSNSESNSDSESEQEEEEEKERFTIVQRYKIKKPLVLRPE